MKTKMSRAAALSAGDQQLRNKTLRAHTERQTEAQLLLRLAPSSNFVKCAPGPDERVRVQELSREKASPLALLSGGASTSVSSPAAALGLLQVPCMAAIALSCCVCWTFYASRSGNSVPC